MTFHGTVGLSDILEVTRVTRAAAIMHYPLLVDLRAASISLKEEDFGGIRAMTLQLAVQSPLGAVAILLGNENDLPAVEKLSQVVSGLVEVRGFVREEEARGWLEWG